MFSHDFAALGLIAVPVRMWLERVTEGDIRVAGRRAEGGALAAG
jgi:hypothetical protein